jgi:hypothetical protein
VMGLLGPAPSSRAGTPGGCTCAGCTTTGRTAVGLYAEGFATGDATFETDVPEGSGRWVCGTTSVAITGVWRDTVLLERRRADDPCGDQVTGPGG